MNRVALSCIAAALALGGGSVGSSRAVAAPARAHARGVTAIVGVVNNWRTGIRVANREQPGSYVDVAAGRTMPYKAWIPWCTSQGAYDDFHYIQVDVWGYNGPARQYAIWQSNESWQDRVRFHDQPWWKPNAAPIPGASEVDGERILEITADGTLYLRRP